MDVTVASMLRRRKGFNAVYSGLEKTADGLEFKNVRQPEFNGNILLHLAGQSNVGMRGDVDRLPSWLKDNSNYPNVKVWYNNTFSQLEIGVNHQSEMMGWTGGAYPLTYHGPEFELAYRLSQKFPNATIYMIKSGYGDTPLVQDATKEDHHPDTSGERHDYDVSLYNAATAYATANGFSFDMVIYDWIQGEYEAQRSEMYAGYETALAYKFQQIAADYGHSNMWFVSNGLPGFNTYDYKDNINTAMQNVCNAMQNAVYVDNSDINDDFDGVHYFTNGANKMAYLNYQAIMVGINHFLKVIPNPLIKGDVAYFNGNDNAINLGNALNSNFANSFSASCWLMYNGPNGENNNVILSNYHGSNKHGFIWSINPDATIRMRFFDGSNNIDCVTTAALTEIDNWYYLSVSWDGTWNSNSIKLEIDGVDYAGSASVTGSMSSYTPGTDDLYISTFLNSFSERGFYLKARIAHLKIVSGVKTYNEIVAATTGIIEEFNFSETTGESVYGLQGTTGTWFGGNSAEGTHYNINPGNATNYNTLYGYYDDAGVKVPADPNNQGYAVDGNPLTVTGSLDKINHPEARIDFNPFNVTDVRMNVLDRSNGATNTGASRLSETYISTRSYRWTQNDLLNNLSTFLTTAYIGKLRSVKDASNNLDKVLLMR